MLRDEQQDHRHDERQQAEKLGAVFGVAVLVAILGPAPGAAAYDAGWWAMGALALLAARLASCCRSRSASQISRHVSIESYINLRAK